MSAPKAIIDNELIREIISIRTNTLWKMLAMEAQQLMPDVHEEGATGKFDNKGAIFIPGGLVTHDVDENPISYQPYPEKSADAFRKSIRQAMYYDNATLLSPEGIASGITIDGGFFSRAARRVITFKKAALRRKKKIDSYRHFEVHSHDIIRSHCPSYFKPPYGSRTRISSYVAIALIEPAMFYSYYLSSLNLDNDQKRTYTQQFDNVRDVAKASDGTILYAPQIVVCHDSRYSKLHYTGLTRILGIGKFGEFATFSLEELTKSLQRECKRKGIEYQNEDIFAHYNDRQLVGILRVYASTTPGRRSKKYQLHVLSPERDLGIDVREIEKEAREQYQIL
ncbi:hypothetical protein [Desulfogranum japonicum]|uniref:hypothetical protein n=1 Tax=Desulfogranum japonicum TaxID=231447 RepID=UPI0003F5E427|nr:hypothetical protein [Desulfogranum japonicum]